MKHSKAHTKKFLKPYPRLLELSCQVLCEITFPILSFSEKSEGEKKQEFPQAPRVACHIKSMCALLHKLSDDMHLYLDSIKKNNELCKVISDTGQNGFAKRHYSWGPAQPGSGTIIF